MRLTADLKARLREAIDGEGWDRAGETTLRDLARRDVDAVETGTVLTDAPEHEAVWDTISYFGFEGVAGDWHDVD